MNSLVDFTKNSLYYSNHSQRTTSKRTSLASVKTNQGSHKMAGKKRIIDMHRADIRAELEKKGTSLAQLGIENGLSRTTVRNALDKPYPKGEKIIADALGLEPSDIWPSRYSG